VKARSNLRKHGDTFEEAASVFRDALSLTIADPVYSTEEERFVTVGPWYIRKQGPRFESSARDPRPGMNRGNMKKARSKREPQQILPQYDFTGGVRGKYAGRFTRDAVMVVLAPDVAEVFPDPKSVNKALRALGGIIRERRGKTGRRTHA
jgi:hypothetical protein